MSSAISKKFPASPALIVVLPVTDIADEVSVTAPPVWTVRSPRLDATVASADASPPCAAAFVETAPKVIPLTSSSTMSSAVTLTAPTKSWTSALSSAISKNSPVDAAENVETPLTEIASVPVSVIEPAAVTDSVPFAVTVPSAIADASVSRMFAPKASTSSSASPAIAPSTS